MALFDTICAECPLSMFRPLPFFSACIAVMALAFFPLAWMCFKANRRRWLVYLCPILFFLPVVAIYVALSPPWVWVLAKAAASLSVSGFSSSYLAIADTIWLAIFGFLQRVELRAMLKDWRN